MKKLIGIALCLIFAVSFVGCSKGQKEKNEMHVYYLNADGNALIQGSYSMMDIDETIKVLEKQGVLSGTIKLDEYKLKVNKLELYFDTEYFSTDKSREVLARAAIVQTFTQITGVDFVEFFVGQDPLTDSKGEAIGLMSAKDFVQNTGSSMGSYKEIDLVLYFADKDGKGLLKESREGVRYNVNTSIERLVVEQLLKGTKLQEGQPVIPDTTMILGVSVKEKICYVNLDSKFITNSYDLNPEVAIYSIVNSIIENGNVSQVQILVDGENDVTYKNTVELIRPLKMNEALIKE